MADEASAGRSTGAAASSSDLLVALGAPPFGIGLMLLGSALRTPDELYGLGGALFGLGEVVFLGGLLTAWLVAMTRLLLTRRGSLAREAAIAAGAWMPPWLVVFLFAEDLRVPPGLAVVPGRLIDPVLAAMGTVLLVGWLAVFGWRVRHPRTDGVE